VATSQLGQVSEILGTVGAPGAFTAQRTATPDDLDIEVKGVGRLRFPISRVQAQRLCSIARPASYGMGEATLYDGRVRNTWEIPKSRVKIDQRRWRRTLLPVLDAMRSDLGLPAGIRLKAAFHGMLVYARGQFFLRHKDSEKADGMVGTLVVTLPSSFKGGAMLVEHQGETVVYRASRQPLSFISFYADCYHEVRPVKSGYRIVLTYDLMIERDGSAAAIAAKPASPKVAALAVDRCVRAEGATRPVRQGIARRQRPRRAGACGVPAETLPGGGAHARAGQGVRGARQVLRRSLDAVASRRVAQRAQVVDADG
jgi:hypothetical protein